MKKQLELRNPDSCLNKAAVDEPIFVLRAKDPLAVQTVKLWATMAHGNHEESKIKEALQWAVDAENWRNRNVASCTPTPASAFVQTPWSPPVEEKQPVMKPWEYQPQPLPADIPSSSLLHAAENWSPFKAGDDKKNQFQQMLQMIQQLNWTFTDIGGRSVYMIARESLNNSSVSFITSYNAKTYATVRILGSHDIELEIMTPKVKRLCCKTLGDIYQAFQEFVRTQSFA